MPTTPNLELKTPFFAAIGAGDLAVATVKDTVTKLREAAGDTTSVVDETRERFAKLSADFPVDITELRALFTPEELRKLAEQYTQAASDLYSSLAERGEEAFERIRRTPVVEERVAKAEGYFGDAVELTEQALGTVATQTRAVGERAAALANRAGIRVGDFGIDIAGASEEAAETASEKISDAAEAVAQQVTDAADKVAETAADVTAAVKSEVKPETKPAARPSATKSPAKKAPAKTAPRKVTPK